MKKIYDMISENFIAETRRHQLHRETAHKLARYALFSFLVTFILARVFVFLIMSKEMPNLYFFMHGTHVHHLNYGIFLLSVVGGYSVFRPAGRPRVGNRGATVRRVDGPDV